MTDKEKRDAAVDAFAADIKKRLDEQATKGYTGWDGVYPAQDLCAQIKQDTAALFIWPFQPRKIIDIGARAMMLHFRTVNKTTTRLLEL
jgi:hypothetical protein